MSSHCKHSTSINGQDSTTTLPRDGAFDDALCGVGFGRGFPSPHILRNNGQRMCRGGKAGELRQRAEGGTDIPGCHNTGIQGEGMTPTESTANEPAWETLEQSSGRSLSRREFLKMVVDRFQFRTVQFLFLASGKYPRRHLQTSRHTHSAYDLFCQDKENS